jgi:uncharacterized protein (DUF1499 family)
VPIRCAASPTLLAVAALLACAGQRPAGLGVEGARLAPCPASPNCVSSDAGDERHAVADLELAAPAPEAWRAAREAVAALPRTRTVAESEGYLHAECRSALFRFVDDLELHLRADAGRIAVRSASRVGRSDLGVNRRRVEDLRAALRARGVVR